MSYLVGCCQKPTAHLGIAGVQGCFERHNQLRDAGQRALAGGLQQVHRALHADQDSNGKTGSSSRTDYGSVHRQMQCCLLALICGLCLRVRSNAEALQRVICCMAGSCDPCLDGEEAVGSCFSRMPSKKMGR